MAVSGKERAIGVVSMAEEGARDGGSHSQMAFWRQEPTL